MSSEKENLSLALGRIPSGLFIVTFYNPELNEPDGMLVSWVQQCSFVPPMVSIAMKKERKSFNLIKKSTNFVVNIMGKQNAKIIGSFYKGVGASKFEGLETQKSEKSEVLILKDAVSFLECKVNKTLELESDHNIIFGEVLNGQLLNSDQNEPSVHLRKNGFDY